ncbi:TPA: DUF4422 domain-containing protein [Streptococcus suis]|nr:DUF4422 domain-containing protein [Streptococcus suis]
MSIFVITHKKFTPFTEELNYKIMLVGANNNKGEAFYLKDNFEEDNISDKNFSFCELTGAYSLYKHCTDDIIGLVHYRRYFMNSEGFPLSFNEAESILEKYDVILPTKSKLTSYKIPVSVKKHFISLLGKDGKEAWEKCSDILKRKYPEMIVSFENFERQNSTYFYNMCVMNSRDFKAYHEWLFDILLQLDKEIDVTSYSKYNQRMFGFISERLLTFWVMYNNKKVKELPIMFTEPISFLNQVKQYVERKLDK